MLRIGIYAGLYHGKGIGHIVRSSTLSNYLKENTDHDIFFSTNDVLMTAKTLIILGIEVDLKWPNDILLDVLLIDSPKSEVEMIINTSYLKLGRFDHFVYSDPKTDFIVNLFNHEFGEKKEQFKGQLYEGLEYTILKDEILQAKNSVSKNGSLLHVLVTFSGNDPNDNTPKVLRTLKEMDVKITVICPPQRDLEEFQVNQENVEVIGVMQNFGQLLNRSDIIICGGGTSLLEAIYFGKPIIAVGQNEMEYHFITMIAEKISLFELSDIHAIVNNYREIAAKTNQEYVELVDGKGKERIKNIFEKKIW